PHFQDGRVLLGGRRRSVKMVLVLWPTLVRPARGLVVGVAGVALVVAVLFPFRDDVTRATPALLLVLPVLAAALARGRRPAVGNAIAPIASLSLTFHPP